MNRRDAARSPSRSSRKRPPARGDRSPRDSAGHAPAPAAGRAAFEASPERDRPLVLFLSEPGLAGLLGKELKHRGTARQKARADKFNLRNYDLLVYPAAQVTGDVRMSRLALHALQAPVFGRRAFTARQLDRLAAAFRREGADGLISSVSGSAFERQDLVRWLTKELRERHVTVALKEHVRRPAWLFVVDYSYWIGFPRFNHHEAPGREGGSERAGALPATIAAAMVFLANPQPGEVVWDPVVGSGATLLEASEMIAQARLIGTDLDAEAVALAAARLRARHADIRVGDSVRADLGRADVSLTLANLPWGRQHQSERPLPELYHDILAACLRHGTPNWRGSFITSDAAAFEQALERSSGLGLESRVAVKVRGIPAEIFLVKRVP